MIRAALAMRSVAALGLVSGLVACGPGGAPGNALGEEAEPTATGVAVERVAESSEEPERRWILRCRPPEGTAWELSADEVIYGDTVTVPDGTREYDLSAAAGRDDAGPAFEGLDGGRRTPEPFEDRFCRTIYEETGIERWPKDTTFLGWSIGDGRRLIVLQDEAGFEAVERVLDRHAIGGGDALRVSAQWIPDLASAASALGIAPPREGTAVLLGTASPRLREGEALAVDAPWGRRARSFEGLAIEYLGDYDVEISQAANLSNPVVLWVESGFAMSAERRVDDETGPGVDVDVAWADRAPPFPTLRTTLLGSEVSIEVPPIPTARFRGVLPAVPGLRALASLDGERGAWIEVGDETGPGRPPRPAWRRAGAPEVRSESAVRVIRVEDPCGASRSSLVFLGPDDPTTLDASWSVTGAVEQPRVLSAERWDFEREWSSTDLHLRTARRVVRAERVFVPAGGDGVLRVGADVGRSPEEIVLVLRRPR